MPLQFMAPYQDGNFTHNSFLSIGKRFINFLEIYRQYNIAMTEFGGSGNKNTHIFR